MLDEDLRAYYRDISVDDESVHRVRDYVTNQPVRRRRRQWVAAGAGAGIAASVVTMAAVLGTAHRDGRQPAASTPTPSTASHSALPTPTPAEHTTRTAAPRLTPPQIVATFTALLPGRWTVQTTRSDAQNTTVDLLVDDGHGAAQVSVRLQYPPRRSYETKPVGCKNDGSTWPAGACTVNDHGEQVLAFKSYEYPADPSRGAKEWYLEILRRDGVKISIHEWNAPTEKGSDATRADPPLTLNQMDVIATSAAWTR